MKLAIGIIVFMCFMYPQKTKSLELAALTAGLNDSQLVSLVGDILLHNPPLLNSLKETVFVGLPLLSDISPPSLHNRVISQVLTLWIEEELPRVVNSSHIKNFVRVFVDNINEIQTTNFSHTNPQNFMHDVFSNMDFVKILKEFTEKEEEFIKEVSEYINVTTIMKLAPETKQLLDSIGVPPKVSSAISKATPYLFLVAQELITSLSKVNQTLLDKNDNLLKLVLKYANFKPLINDFLHQNLFSNFTLDKNQKIIIESIANGIIEGGCRFLLSYGQPILQATLRNILHTNMSDINSTNPNVLDQFLNRLDKISFLSEILEVVKEPFAKLLHIQQDKLMSLASTFFQNSSAGRFTTQTPNSHLTVAELAKGKCDQSWINGDGNCLKFFNKQLSWLDAEQACRAENAELAIDDSRDKSDLLKAFLNVFHGWQMDKFWIRGIGTQEVIPSHLAAGVQNGAAGSSCTYIKYSNVPDSQLDLLLFHENCDQRHFFICEKRLLSQGIGAIG